MDKPTTTAAIVAAVTGVFSAGAFKFYEFMLKQKRLLQLLLQVTQGHMVVLYLQKVYILSKSLKS